MTVDIQLGLVTGGRLRDDEERSHRRLHPRARSISISSVGEILPYM